jgi:hypothetical protein
MADLQHFLDPAYRYDFWQGPEKVRSDEDARQKGLNCVSLAHLALRNLFNETLPPEMHCYEMYADDAYFKTLGGVDETQQGDLVWFGRQDAAEPALFVPQYAKGSSFLENWRDSPVKHVAVCTGERYDGEPLLLHATHIEGTNVIWPLRKFEEHERYARVLRVARFMPSALLV